MENYTHGRSRKTYSDGVRSPGMPQTDELIDHFREQSGVEVDHAIHLYINNGRTVPWIDIIEIDQCGYRIQDITSKEYQTKVTLVQK